jgi:hypothetical protein
VAAANEDLRPGLNPLMTAEKHGGGETKHGGGGGGVGGRKSGVGEHLQGLIDKNDKDQASIMAYHDEHEKHMGVVDRVLGKHSVHRPGDKFKGAAYDPKTGFPIDPATGYAVDPITKMKIDPVTNRYLDETTRYPIDPDTGYARDPVTGAMFDPVRQSAVVFHYHDQIVNAPKETNHADVVLRSLLGNGGSDAAGGGGGHGGHGGDRLPNRRIEGEFEQLTGWRAPFREFPLFRGVGGAGAGVDAAPHAAAHGGAPGEAHGGAHASLLGHKAMVGSVKANFAILPQTRRHEKLAGPADLSRKYLQNKLTVRVNVLKAWEVIAATREGARRAANGAGRSAESKDGGGKGGDKRSSPSPTGNLYLRVRCGRPTENFRNVHGRNPTKEELDRARADELDLVHVPGGRKKKKGDGGGDAGDRFVVHWNTASPDFYKTFSLNVVLPGQAKLEVELWDHICDEDAALRKSYQTGSYNRAVDLSDTAGDVLLGRTEIDLENRWFSLDWRRLEHKPLERRTLWAPTSNHAQGKLEMWCDILPMDKAQYIIPRRLSPPKPMPFELRVIVWSARGVSFRRERYKRVSVTGEYVGRCRECDERSCGGVGGESEDGRGAKEIERERGGVCEEKRERCEWPPSECC